MFPYFYLTSLILINFCTHVSSDYNVTSDDAHDSEYKVIEAAGEKQTVSDESVLVPKNQRSLDLATVRGWGIFLIVVLCLVLICLLLFAACKLFSRSSRGMMDRIYPGVHVTLENEAISTGRCTRINF